MILHTINKDSGSGLLDCCLRHANRDDTIVFMEDGVYCAMDNTLNRTWIESTKGAYRLCVLNPDVMARGLSGRCPDCFTCIDYSDLVELCTQAQKIINWC